MFDSVLEFIKGILAKEPARVTAYGAGVVLAAAVWLANLWNWELSAEMQASITFVAAGVIAELIRRLVFSPATTQAIADRAAETGNTNIGDPPKGSVE